MVSPLVCRYYKSPSFQVFFFALLCFWSLLCCNALVKEAHFAFSFDGFGNKSSSDQIVVYGDAKVGDNVVRLTKQANCSTGLMAYRNPIRFWGTKPGFSTYLSFSVSPGNGGLLTFFLVPSSVQLESSAIVSNAIWIELLNCSDIMIANGRDNLIRINVGKQVTLQSYYLSANKMVLKDGERLHSWIDYDGASKRIEVRLSKFKNLRPANPSVSVSIDLSNIFWSEAMLAGLILSKGDYNQSLVVYSWNFTVNHGTPYRMHSEPLDPNKLVVHSRKASPIHSKRVGYPLRMLMLMLFAGACGALVTLLVMYLWTSFVSHRQVTPVEYPVHPVDVVYEKIVLVGSTDVDCAKK